MLKVSVEGQAGQNINDDIEVVTNVQTLAIGIQTAFVSLGSTALPQGQVSNQVTITPDSSVRINVNNTQANTASFNNLKLTIPNWLADIATNLQGGTITTNTETDTTTITYSINGANVDLAPGQTHTFSFDLGGDQNTVDTLLAYYDEMIDNSVSEAIVINASNLRNPLTPNLTVSLTPASMPDEVTLTDPATPQTITLQNLSNSQLRITGVDDTNLPTGVTVTGGTCVDQLIIEPKDDTDDSCTVELTVQNTAVPEADKTLSINYEDPQNNSFEDSTIDRIGGAEISVALTSIELPTSGDETADVTITNTGQLNWIPSGIDANYQITLPSQSSAADNISVTNGSGTDCLTGTLVAPGGTCDIGIQVNGDTTEPVYTAPGSYVLNILPSNNLEITNTTNFNITEPTLGSFQFQSTAGQDITTQNFEIGDSSPINITLKNVGAIEITDVYLSVPAKFTIADPSSGTACPQAVGDAISLENEESCSLELSVAAGSGVGDGTYSITANGNATTVNNNGQSLAATVQGAALTIEPGISIRKLVGDTTVTELTITNNGTNTIPWNPSTDVNDYVISVTGGGGSIAGISVVDPGVGANPYCAGGAEVAVGDSCRIGIETTNTVTDDSYTLTLNLTNNLAAEQSESFDITGALGFFSFSPAEITIGSDSTSQPQTITLNNDGETDITNAYLDIASGITVTSNNCGTSGSPMPLSSGGNCTFQVAADNSTAQPNYLITAIGDAGTVENNNQTFTATVDGVVVQIEPINPPGNNINRTAAGSDVTDVEITNLGGIDWNPSLQTSSYLILPITGVPPTIVAPSPSSIPDCLTGAAVTSGNSCYIGIQTSGENNTTIGDYTLQVLAIGNLPQASNTQSFTITDSLGYFVYKNASDQVITTLDLTIGDSDQTITLENIGETAITNLVLNAGGDSANFTVTSPVSEGCDFLTNSTLPAEDSCIFNLAVNAGVDADDYTFATTGTNASNSPIELTVTAESSCTPIPVGDYEWAPDANLGVLANAAGVPGVNANGRMDWNTATGGFIEWLNSENYCGHSDWEIPSLAQYGCTATFGICDQAVAGGLLSSGWFVGLPPDFYLPALGFTNVQSTYWSGTEDGVVAWTLEMGSGSVINLLKTSELSVLPVRSD